MALVGLVGVAGILGSRGWIQTLTYQCSPGLEFRV